MEDIVTIIEEESLNAPLVERLNITPTSPSYVGPILRAKLVVFERNGVLRFSDPGQKVLGLVADEMHIQDGNKTCEIVIPARSGTSGGDGADGGNHAIDKRHGGHGAQGGAGTDGSSPPPFVLWVRKLTYGIAPSVSQPPLVVTSAGGSGGNGGNGGDGGAGRNGHKSWPGIGGPWGSEPP